MVPLIGVRGWPAAPDPRHDYDRPAGARRALSAACEYVAPAEENPLCRASRICDSDRVRHRRDELRTLLNDWDFIGVFESGGEVDEYDCMLEPLLRRLSAGADAHEVGEWLDGEISGHFGMSVDSTSTRAMAEQLATWWHADRDSRTD